MTAKELAGEAVVASDASHDDDEGAAALAQTTASATPSPKREQTRQMAPATQRAGERERQRRLSSTAAKVGQLDECGSVHSVTDAGTPQAPSASKPVAGAATAVSTTAVRHKPSQPAAVPGQQRRSPRTAPMASKPVAAGGKPSGKPAGKPAVASPGRSPRQASTRTRVHTVPKQQQQQSLKQHSARPSAAPAKARLGAAAAAGVVHRTEVPAGVVGSTTPPPQRQPERRREARPETTSTTTTTITSIPVQPNPEQPRPAAAAPAAAATHTPYMPQRVSTSSPAVRASLRRPGRTQRLAHAHAAAAARRQQRLTTPSPSHSMHAMSPSPRPARATVSPAMYSATGTRFSHAGAAPAEAASDRYSRSAGGMGVGGLLSTLQRPLGAAPARAAHAHGQVVYGNRSVHAKQDRMRTASAVQ